MAGQSAIIATGAIEYPAEYHAMAPEALSHLGISKAVTITSTYDHRIIQGAESGAFLAHVHELLLGEHDFYDEDFPRPRHRLSSRCAGRVDHNPALLGRRPRARAGRRSRRASSNSSTPTACAATSSPTSTRCTRCRIQYHPELDIETYGLTIWDLDREFITGGLGGKESATLREILDILRRAYCGKVGTEYRHIQSKEQKIWIRERIRRRVRRPRAARRGDEESSC